MSAFSSQKYWQNRYREGGHSGAGSYGRLAAFKAEFLNDFVAKQGITSVIEFGSGDGAQLKLAKYPTYLGLDVSEEAVDRCRQSFSGDDGKTFLHTSDYTLERAELSLSLDVIYHLIEDDVFQDYMSRLFYAAERYVIVYASNYDAPWPAEHVKHRMFTDWVEQNHADFRLIAVIPNRYPLSHDFGNADHINDSFSEFFVFERMASVRHTLPGHLVVSVTSHANRFPTLGLTLRRILQQSVQPDAVVLWVSAADREQIPRETAELERLGLTIRVAEDLGPYTKIIPALQEYPDSFILTLDDDIDYPRDHIEPLIKNYRSDREILCRRAHIVKYDDGSKPLPYSEWQFETGETEHPDLFPTGVGGVLYPPRSLGREVLNDNAFRKLTPITDDIWLFFMARLAGTSRRRVGPRVGFLRAWYGSEDVSLMQANWSGGNDQQFAAMIERYGRI